jgi:hypothetical protein
MAKLKAVTPPRRAIWHGSTGRAGVEGSTAGVAARALSDRPRHEHMNMYAVGWRSWRSAQRATPRGHPQPRPGIFRVTRRPIPGFENPRALNKKFLPAENPKEPIVKLKNHSFSDKISPSPRRLADRWRNNEYGRATGGGPHLTQADWSGLGSVIGSIFSRLFGGGSPAPQAPQAPAQAPVAIIPRALQQAPLPPENAAPGAWAKRRTLTTLTHMSGPSNFGSKA